MLPWQPDLTLHLLVTHYVIIANYGILETDFIYEQSFFFFFFPPEQLTTLACLTMY